VRSDINVTPLVDVMLVLLIIFMVVTPMLQKGPAVRLPLTEEPPKKPEDQKQILVAVQNDEVVWIDKEKTTRDGFEDRIRETFQRNPGTSVVIKGDARLDFGTVKRVILGIRDAGFKDVGLVAEKRNASN
jgi:biopolymer transport protein ExbD